MTCVINRWGGVSELLSFTPLPNFSKVLKHIKLPKVNSVAGNYVLVQITDKKINLTVSNKLLAHHITFNNVYCAPEMKFIMSLADARTVGENSFLSIEDDEISVLTPVSKFIVDDHAIHVLNATDVDALILEATGSDSMVSFQSVGYRVNSYFKSLSKKSLVSIQATSDKCLLISGIYKNDVELSSNNPVNTMFNGEVLSSIASLPKNCEVNVCIAQTLISNSPRCVFQWRIEDIKIETVAVGFVPEYAFVPSSE